MKKYLVEIYLPACGEHYDAFLPVEKKIYEVTKLLVDIADTLSGGSYKGTKDAMLLSAETGEPFPPDITVYDAGIRNASRLILI